MSKPNFSLIAGSIKSSAIKHSPEILTGIGITGMITATVLAVKATPRALTLIEERQEEENTEVLSLVETVKTAWIYYIPAAVTFVLSAACLIGANSVNARRNAAIATAYALSDSAFRGYQEKVIETIGERKEQSVKDAVAKDKIKQNPVSNNTVIITEKGNQLCYDAISGRYFRSDIDKLRKAENILNQRMRDEMCISLNDLYLEIGLDPISIGDSIGWDIDNGIIELQFSSQLADDESPCIVVDYRVAPKYNFAEL
jgi:hypothetical protein